MSTVRQMQYANSQKPEENTLIFSSSGLEGKENTVYLSLEFAMMLP